MANYSEAKGTIVVRAKSKEILEKFIYLHMKSVQNMITNVQKKTLKNSDLKDGCSYEFRFFKRLYLL